MKRKTTILCLGILGIAALNLIGFNVSTGSKCDLKMQNIETLSALAIEGWCDGESESLCTITVGDHVVKGTGQPHIVVKD